MARSRARECGWRTGRRTACPVLVDNLSDDEVDAIWGDISRVNWRHRAEDRWAGDGLDNGLDNGQAPIARKKHRSRKAGRAGARA